MQKFKNRQHAGQVLAGHLKTYQDHPDAIILALPRGGVPVAFEIANKLHLPLDVYIVRKIGMPGYEELAIGAIASDDVTIFNAEIMHELSLSVPQLNSVISKERHELARRNKLYRANKPPIQVKDKIVILVDDGLATGASMRAAIIVLKKMQPAKIIVAVPVGAREVCQQLKPLADDVICASQPEPFYGVGQWYIDFDQTTDEEVIQLLSTPTTL